MDVAKPTKPFPVYLRETPAQPFSPLTKAVFLVLGVIVAALFLAALWRISQSKRPKVQPSQPPEKAAMLVESAREPCATTYSS